MTSSKQPTACRRKLVSLLLFASVCAWLVVASNASAIIEPNPPTPGGPAIRYGAYNAFLPMILRGSPVSSTPTSTPTSTLTPTQTPTRTGTPAQTPTPTVTHTPIPTPTGTQTQTQTPTGTHTPTPTSTSTHTHTPTPTGTHTPTPTSTSTQTNTPTPTPTPTKTGTPTIFERPYAIFTHYLGPCEAGNYGLVIGGNEDLNIIGGGLFSNACIVKNGNGDVTIEPEDLHSYCAGNENCYIENGNGPIVPPPGYTPGPLPVSYLGIPVPDCSGLPDFGDHTGGGVIEPGIYGNIMLSTSETLTMQPGLYCVQGEYFWVSNGVVTGDGVTIYVLGDFHTTANALIDLRAPEEVGSPSDGILDVLVYAGEGSQVLFSGGANSSFNGVVFGPGESILLVRGYSNTATFNVQLIASEVYVSSNAEFDIVYDPKHGYPKP